MSALHLCQHPQLVLALQEQEDDASLVLLAPAPAGEVPATQLGLPCVQLLGHINSRRHPCTHSYALPEVPSPRSLRRAHGGRPSHVGGA